MEIDLKSAAIGAAIGAGVGAVVIWLGSKLAKKPNKDETTTSSSWKDLSEIEKYFNQPSRSEKSKVLSDNVRLMKEIVDSNMPVSLIREAGEEVGITFVEECRKEMIGMVIFMKGNDGVNAIESRYRKWQNKEFSNKNDFDSHQFENKSEESK